MLSIRPHVPLHHVGSCFDVLNLIFLNNCTFLGTFGINTAAPSVGTTLAVQGDVALDNLVTLEMTFNL